MGQGQMIHFLMIFNHATSTLLSAAQYEDPADAAAAYAAAEREHGGTTDLEIVLVGADSLKTIQRTHGQYFAEDPFISKYLTLAV